MRKIFDCCHQFEKTPNLSKKMVILFLLCISSSALLFSQTNRKIRVACVGNSVTYGAGIENRDIYAYPAQLQELLGNPYEVGNFGKNGATLLSRGHRPYIQQEEFKKALEFQPDLVVIHLGLNDTDPRNWPAYGKDFIRDYAALIDSFRNLESQPRIWICKMTPIFHGHSRFKSGTRDWFWQIQEKITTVAHGQQTGLIDFHTPLYSRPDLLPDNVHPDKTGASILAQTVYSEITGDFGGLKIPDFFQSHMVLQRDTPISIFGTANRDEEIEVVFDGKTQKTTPDVHGNWKVSFPAYPAGGPYTIHISGKQEEIILEDVWIGDVYLCSGQSNMAFSLSQSLDGNQEIAKAHHPDIRLYHMKPVAYTHNEKWTKDELDKTNELAFFQAQWQSCTPQSAAEFSAIAYYFGQNLHQETGVPIGLIQNAIGGSPTESWIDRKTLEMDPVLVDLLSDWPRSDFINAFCKERAQYNIEDADHSLQRHPYHPAYLYETGVDPLSGLAIRGVIWYQGESNAHNTELHEVLFPALVKSWRNLWGASLPFYFVQLSSINRPGWELFRDSQRRLADSIAHCEMVVSSDVGDPDDVHPIEKKPIGERLALVALHQLYGMDVDWQGPRVRQYTILKNKIEVEYEHAKELKTSDGEELRGFEIAGEDEIYHPAQPRIVGTTIELSSDQVREPHHFRYGYQPYSEGNLIDENGLPASTYASKL